jgi:hypothetical protein
MIAASAGAILASTSPLLAQALEMKPAIAQPAPNQDQDPTNPPALEPPVFVETSGLGSIAGIHPDLKGAIDVFNGIQSDLETFQGNNPGYIPPPGGAGPEPDIDDDPAGHAQWVIDKQYENLQGQLNTASDDLNREFKQHKGSISGAGATCADQLDDVAFGLSTAGFATELAGDIAESITSPGSIVGAEIASNIISAVGVGLGLTGTVIEGVQNSLPNCEGVFTGTVQTYANFVSKMGLSTFDGAITLGYNGNPTYNSAGQKIDPTQYYYEGITLGGGGLAGAGYGGAQAYTGDKDAIAIGNGARAEEKDSTAIGTDAWATKEGATAIGAHTRANGLYSTVVGNSSSANGTNDAVIGYNNQTGAGGNNFALGTGIRIIDGPGGDVSSGNTALGVGHIIQGDNNFVGGDPNETFGSSNQVVGNDNFTAGFNNQVLGSDNGEVGAPGFDGTETPGIRGDFNSIVGNNNAIGSGAFNDPDETSGHYNKVFGNDNKIKDSDAVGDASSTAVYNSIVGNANDVTGDGNFLGGFGNLVASDYSKVIGNSNFVQGGDQNAVFGDYAFVNGSQNVAFGFDTAVTGPGGATTVVNGIAVGTQAAVTGSGGIAIGANMNNSVGPAGVGAYAATALSVAIGADAQGGGSSGAVGTAVGSQAAATGANSTAYGQGSQALGNQSTALGQGAQVSAGSTDSLAVGQAAQVVGTQTTAVGTGASAIGNSVESLAVGYRSNADGSQASTAAGAFSTVTGTSEASAYGHGATVSAGTTGGTASGTGARVQASYGSAYGHSSQAAGQYSTAVGYDSHALADGSAAYGNGAVATLTNQQVFGTSSNTYTTPGITSSLSRQRQSGPLQLTTTDINGNLASDNGDTFIAVSRLQAGVAIAMAAEAPPLTASQNFGVRIGWGNYQGDANAVAASAIGVLCRGCFSSGDRITVDGAIGAGWSDYKTYNSGNTLGGRAGLSWGW